MVKEDGISKNLYYQLSIESGEANTEQVGKINHGHSHRPATTKKLGVAALAMLTFYAVNGGPFGIEDIVRAGGPLLAICGFSLLFVWAVPEALITAELSTTFPTSSGSVAWVEAAFGPFWSFQKGWLSWLSGVADNALYPILFYDCVVQLLSFGSTGVTAEMNGGDDFIREGFTNDYFRIIFIATLTVLLTFLNLRGLDVVGDVAMVICAVSLTPFIFFCILGAPKVEPSRWFIAPENGLQSVNWRLLLNTFFWNVNFWESAACFSADVAHPESTYPKGMAVALAIVFVFSFFPILVGIGISNEPYSEWTDGHFVRLASMVGGRWLGGFMLVGAAISSIGMFEAEMSSDAWQICGMAEDGTLPKVLATRNNRGVPTYGVIMSASGVVLLSVMSFSDVIDMLNMLYCFGQLIEFAAFLYLRYKRPDLPRPYTVPLGLIGMTLLLIPPVILILIIVSFSSYLTMGASIILAILGVVTYHVLVYAKKNNWANFVKTPEEMLAEVHAHHHSTPQTVPLHHNNIIITSTSNDGVKNGYTATSNTTYNSHTVDGFMKHTENEPLLSH